MDADHLLAIFLVTTVPSSGSNVVFRYPSHPVSSPRFTRPLYDRSSSRVGGRTRSTTRSRLAVQTGLSQAAGWDGCGDDEISSEDDDLFWKPLSIEDTKPKESAPTRKRRPTKAPRSPQLAPTKTTSEIKEALSNTFYLPDYDRCLGYPYGDLKFFLSAKREACHRRFELSIDEITFLGYPVCPKDGENWEVELQGEERGRGRISRQPALPTAGTSPSSPPLATPPPPPPLSQFQLVLVLDKPDPVSFNSAPSVLYDTLYEEVAFKWTAAAFAEQCRTGWVARECARLGLVIEDSINRHIPLKQAHEEAFRVSSLAQSIKDLYIGLKTKSSAQVMVGEIPVDFRLPQRVSVQSEEWTKWGDLPSESSESESEDDEWDDIDGEKRVGEMEGIKLRPWRTLLKMKGGGKVGTARDTDDRMEFEENELNEPIEALLGALDPALTIAQIAERMNLNLKADIYPLAEHLIYTERVKVIDVVGPRLRGMYLPDTTSDRSLPEIMVAWSREFPSLPSFDAFISRLSSSIQLYRKMIPHENFIYDRMIYEQALFWLLEHDLVIRLHTYVRIVAFAKIKGIARQRHVEAHIARLQVGGAKHGQPTPLQESKGSSKDGSTDGRVDAPSSATPPSELNLKLYDDLDDSIIYEPGEAAQKTEGRWIQAMLEGHRAHDIEHFKQVLPYFNGTTTLEEMQYRTHLDKREIRHVMAVFKEHLITFQHP